MRREREGMRHLEGRRLMLRDEELPLGGGGLFDWIWSWRVDKSIGVGGFCYIWFGFGWEI